MKLKQLPTLLLAATMTIVAMSSCTSTKKVTRVDENEQIDLSGRWNDTDSRLVSEEMISDALGRAWLSDFQERNGRKPVVIIGQVKNKTSEHIATDTFIGDMEREFVNSGRVKVVQGGDAREELREERDDQQTFSSPETAKKWAKEKGADLMLQGIISSISDSNGRKDLVFYQTDLTLTDLETNEKLWIGQKKIKKVVN